jgi:hypothetical protein
MGWLISDVGTPLSDVSFGRASISILSSRLNRFINAGGFSVLPQYMQLIPYELH